jgi:hypothetical protein
MTSHTKLPFPTSYQWIMSSLPGKLFNSNHVPQVKHYGICNIHPKSIKVTPTPHCHNLNTVLMRLNVLQPSLYYLANRLHQAINYNASHCLAQRTRQCKTMPRLESIQCIDHNSYNSFDQLYEYHSLGDCTF